MKKIGLSLLLQSMQFANYYRYTMTVIEYGYIIMTAIKYYNCYNL